MKINILSPGRFHVCDLARELDALGWDVAFYSFVPTKRAAKFGLPKRCSKSVFWFVLPFLILSQLFPKNRLFRIWRIKWQDFITANYMRKCDILIAMSGGFVCSLKTAKKGGACVILERGSKHILEQKRILEAIPSLQGKKPVPDINVARELDGYKLADFITIASTHVKESFLKYKYPNERLFLNPYGVNVSMFYPVNNQQKKYDIIMVGGWSYRKGCDLLIDAGQKLNITLLHVGPIVDLPFPNNPGFFHLDAVDQDELVKYYAQAKVFVLPSREEGLAMVQMQAIACGLPLVCSKHSGGEDLARYFPKSDAIFVVEDLTVTSLINAIQRALSLAIEVGHGTLYNMDGIRQLTWEAYGKRYSNFLHRVFEK